MNPTEELEDIAVSLRQTAWILGEFWEALKGAHLPDDVAASLVVDYHYECILTDTVTDG
jgi:hypothetical protein